MWVVVWDWLRAQSDEQWAEPLDPQVALWDLPKERWWAGPKVEQSLGAMWESKKERTTVGPMAFE